MRGDRCLNAQGWQTDVVYQFCRQSEHVSAEMRVQIVGHGRTMDEWKLLAHRPDNYWLDCVVGYAVTGSMQGTEHVGAASRGVAKKKKRLKLSGPQWQRKP